MTTLETSARANKLARWRQLYLLIILVGVSSLWALQAQAMGMGGGSDVGTVSVNSFYRDTGDTSSPYDLILNFNRTNGSDHIHSWRLTVDNGSSSQTVCDKIDFHDDNSPDDSEGNAYWSFTNNDDNGDGTFNFDNDYSDDAYPSGGLRISDLLTQVAGTYTVTVAIYSEDDCDTSGTDDSDTGVFTVSGPNSSPVITDAGATLAYSEGDAATVIDSTLTITDSDNSNMASATITISSGYQSSEDVLAFTNANGITGSWNSGAGVMTLSGSATKANYETALESVTYQNTNNDNPDNTNNIITWVVNDSNTNSSGVTSTITIADTNDAPVAVDDTINATENRVFTSSTDLDANDTDVDGNSLTVTAGTFSTSQSGSLVLASDGSYTYTPATDFTGTDTVNYTVTDGALTDTGTLTITVSEAITVVAVDDFNSIQDNSNSLDNSSNALTNDTGDSLTVTAIRTGSETGTGTSGSVGSSLSGDYGNLTINSDGSYSYSPTQSISSDDAYVDSFTYTTSDGTNSDTADLKIAIYDNGNDYAISFNIAQNPSDNSSPFNLTIDATAIETDGGGDNWEDTKLTITQNGSNVSNSPDCSNVPNEGRIDNTETFTFQSSDDASDPFDIVLAPGTYQASLIAYKNSNCSSQVAVSSTVTFTVTHTNASAVITDAGGTLAYSEGDAATVIDSTLTITDSDNSNMASATITISSGYQSSEDVLAFTDANGITGSWNSGSGVMPLSGSATKANYEAALESVTYQNSNSDDPDNTNRTVTWVVNDGTNNSSAVTSTITV
ncbi:MAG: Ig-like domain-containing protein, partial [Gammaproteobacteria bacterium]|nr:Ig-like domain-containing protein [Gammaproteobacteria bacterium]